MYAITADWFKRGYSAPSDCATSFVLIAVHNLKCEFGLCTAEPEALLEATPSVLRSTRLAAMLTSEIPLRLGPLLTVYLESTIDDALLAFAPNERYLRVVLAE